MCDTARIQNSFQRYEKKFLLTQEQYQALSPMLSEHLVQDEYGQYTICNIYYDTGSYDLIRTSLDKPVYKEKFRLRSYGVPGADDLVFAEIKKKFNGIVYKRRVEATPSEIDHFMNEEAPLSQDPQIQSEIRSFLHQYHPQPKVFIGYDRTAYKGIDDDTLRITFDDNIRYRTQRLDLREGDDGELITHDNKIVMEVKCAATLPLWLVAHLSKLQIYPASFSKYGTCYVEHLLAENFELSHKSHSYRFSQNYEGLLQTS